MKKTLLLLLDRNIVIIIADIVNHCSSGDVHQRVNFARVESVAPSFDAQGRRGNSGKISVLLFYIVSMLQ